MRASSERPLDQKVNQTKKEVKMKTKPNRVMWSHTGDTRHPQKLLSALGRAGSIALAAGILSMTGMSVQAADKKPNILVIMGDDVGWFNLGCYHQGIMSGKTPNLDKLASQGMRFTDYTPKPVARRAARILSPVKFPCARG